MSERIKLIRQALKIKQSDFAKKLNLSQGHLSDLENNRKVLTDRTIADICREFSVDYMWLTTGYGEMFSSAESDYIALIDRVMAGENEFARNVFKTFAKFGEDDWLALEKMIDLFLETKKEPSE